MITVMSTTVAVTLITALSTLTGASISGYVAYLVSRTQGYTQIELAKDQMIEQRMTAKRQTQRDAYLQFLNQVRESELLLDNLWEMKTPVTHADYQRVITERAITLERSEDLVALESSIHLRSIAHNLVRQLR